MNRLTVIGNLTRDPELKTTANGTRVCTFTVAVNKKSDKGHPEADYFRVSAWREQGERCAEYLRKGKKVCVIGPVTANGYADRQTGEIRASLEMTAREVEFLSPREQGDGGESAAAVDAQSGFEQVEDEDIPFG